MDRLIVGALGLVLLLVFVFLGLPLPIIFIIIGLGGIALIGDWSQVAQVMQSTAFSRLGEGTYEWTVIPLFTMMGIILFECGIADNIYRAVRQWVGHLPGGMAAATSGACAAIGTMSGSGIATAALMSKVAYPEMKKYNYQPAFAMVTCACSATTAMMMPPSIVIVIFAIVAEASIGRCLLAGVIPSILSMAIYMVMIFIRCRINPSLGPAQPSASWSARIHSLTALIPVVIMMAIIIGGIYFGIFTATEAAGMGVLVSFLIVIAMKRLTWARLKKIILETTRLSILMMLILMTIEGFYCRFLNLSGVTMTIGNLALGFSSPWVTIVAMYVIMFLFGMFVGDPLGFVILPIFAPVIKDMGFDIIWFVLTMIKMIELGAVTPPVCMAIFVSQGIVKEVSIDSAYKAVVPFIVCDVLTLGLMVFIPQITLFLPYLSSGG